MCTGSEVRHPCITRQGKQEQHSFLYEESHVHCVTDALGVNIRSFFREYIYHESIGGLAVILLRMYCTHKYARILWERHSKSVVVPQDLSLSIALLYDSCNAITAAVQSCGSTTLTWSNHIRFRDSEENFRASEHTHKSKIHIRKR